MGMPARRIEADPFARRSHLRLVETPAPAADRRRTASSGKTRKPARTLSQERRSTSSKVSAATRTRIRREEARARTVFWAFTGVLCCALILGGARVTFIARAAEATITQSRLQAAMKAQRAESDALEVDRSTLSTPSRIAGIASTSMNMAEPKSVRYISIDAAATSAGAGSAGANASATGNDAIGALIGAVVDLSAGEAQSLLVGDLGLAGSR
jgi:cell division protein FtsL